MADNKSTMMVPRAEYAASLRAAGLSLRAVANKMKVKISQAAELVTEGSKELADYAGKDLTILRLNTLLDKYYVEALTGDGKALSLVLKIMDMHIKLCGGYPKDYIANRMANAKEMEIQNQKDALTLAKLQAAALSDSELGHSPLPVEIKAIEGNGNGKHHGNGNGKHNGNGNGKG